MESTSLGTLPPLRGRDRDRSASSGPPVAKAMPGETTLSHSTGNEAMAEFKANILIVDDIPDKLLVYRTVLEELGQNIVTATSGAEALKQVLRDDFAVILLDVNMPDIDGFETAELIRQRKRSAHTPIIFLTSFADEVRIEQGYARGGVDYIPAPVIPEILRAKVRVFVELFRMRQQVALQAEERAKRAAAEESARRSAFLADVSRSLAMSLDFEATLATLLCAPIPQLADVCLVTLRDGDNGPTRTLSAALDGERIVQHELQETPAEFLRFFDELLETGMPARYSRSLTVALDPRPASTGEVSMMNAVFLPLIARGRVQGIMTFAKPLSRSPMTPAEVRLAEEFSSRAAIALDNAVLVRDIQDADQRKNEFLAMLAHELRNPLAPIRNAVHIMRRHGNDPANVDWARDIIDRQIATLVRMVDDLLDVARINQGKIQLVMDAVDINDVVTRALETSRPIIEAQEHTLHVALPESPVRVRGDVTRLAQVVSNLLNNAAKYTPSGGRIEVHAECDGGDAVVSVRDNGRGIPQHQLDKIFDLFTQLNQSIDRNRGGLGIGLTLVRSLIEMHGGSVRASSDGINKGSEFIVRLPVYQGILPSDTATSCVENRPTSGQRILVVDDNLDVAESFAMVLQIHGYDVRVVHDGLAALREAEAFDPQVVFLDIGLPELNGYETARRIRRSEPKSLNLLVAISGYGRDEDITRSREAGFDDHLVKPVAPDTIIRLLANASTAGSMPG
jgi:signal transduction histidine kinase/DNA-binding response OmpR family regulator